MNGQKEDKMALINKCIKSKCLYYKVKLVFGKDDEYIALKCLSCIWIDLKWIDNYTERS